ncbi:MAG: pseudouridine synthase [Candidatus Campbellbacteria bacterium]|nr:pseudouridine synthase [Candidatus Campbellbacteria bacterium]
MKDSNFPVRINKYLKDKGIASRRKADDLILNGEVTINDEAAQIGQKVFLGDEVAVSDRALEESQNKIYLLVNKPVGIVSHNPLPGQKEVLDLLPQNMRGKGLAVLGRLDRASRGLMLLSNDGTIVDKLLNPRSKHEKEYIVEVDKPLRHFFLKRMREGIHLSGGITSKQAEVEKINDTTFKIVLTEGKKHQIRRMADAFGFAVRDLKRIRIATLTLGKLKEGDHKILKGKELEKFRNALE